MVDMEDGQAGDDEDDDDSSSKGSRSATVAGRRAAPSSRLDARSAAAAGSRGGAGAGAAEDGEGAEEVVVSATVQDILRRPRWVWGVIMASMHACLSESVVSVCVAPLRRCGMSGVGVGQGQGILRVQCEQSSVLRGGGGTSSVAPVHAFAPVPLFPTVS